jgi:hypothetical protein
VPGGAGAGLEGYASGCDPRGFRGLDESALSLANNVSEPKILSCQQVTRRTRG